MPEGGQRLGSAARGRWALRAQRSHRRVLPGAPAPATGDGQCAHARNRQTAQRESAGAMVVAWSLGQTGGRRWDIDARYAAEPGGLSAAQHPGPRCWISAGPTGHGDLPGHRRGARYGGWTTQWQRHRRTRLGALLARGLSPGRCDARRCPVLQLLPDCHADGGRCGCVVRAKRSAHHRLVTVASRWARAITSCAGPSLRRAHSG